MQGITPGGYSLYPWVGRCGQAPHTLPKPSTTISLPKPSTTTYGLNSFSYSSVKYWNSLPDHFRMTVDYSEFKRKLLVHGFS